MNMEIFQKSFKSLIKTLAFSSLIFAAGCINQGNKSPQKMPSDAEIKEQMIEANYNMVEVESEQIDAFVQRRGWKMQKSGTGLRYMIYEGGKGPNATTGQVAKVNYEVTLLDGTKLYSSQETGPQEFLIGMDNVESGLHEGITYMNVGSKAKMILPIHLAHGLLGDENKIPSNATIIYDIELLALK